MGNISFSGYISFMIVSSYNRHMNNSSEPTRSTHFGKTLRYFRRRAGLTQTELGNLVKAGQTTIVGWEKQADPPDDPFMLAELARVLQAPIEYLEKGLIPTPAIGLELGDRTIERINVNLLTIKRLDPNGINMADTVIGAMVAELQRRRKAREDGEKTE